MNSDTPETDREADHASNILADCEREAHQTGSNVDAWVVDAEFARTLERDRDRLRAERDALIRFADQIHNTRWEAQQYRHNAVQMSLGHPGEFPLTAPFSWEAGAPETDTMIHE